MVPAPTAAPNVQYSRPNGKERTVDVRANRVPHGSRSRRGERPSASQPQEAGEPENVGCHDRVTGMLAALQTELGARNERLIVGGFSQGSMVACNSVFTRDVRPAGLAILSGTPVALNT